MDTKDLDSSSEESLGSDGDDQEFNDEYGNKIAESDSLLDSSDSDESESESMDATEGMDVDENVINEQLLEINNQLAENPFAYDLYVGKIKILKKIGDLDKLRETREKFAEMYPLSEQIWLDWIKDEIKLACTDEEKDEVEKLFERAIGDYLSVELWLEYLNFCISRMDANNGQEKCREVFERAIAACGIHVSMGSLIWDMYRDFEAALLGAAANEEQMQTQENRFITLCRRQLSVPLLGLKNTYEDIKSKIDIDDNTENGYKKAVERLSTLEIWEGKLVEQQEGKLSIYRDYIEEEKKSKSNPARIQCLYERAIVDFPLDSSLWLEYLDYLSKNLKIDHIILDSAKRASRNCSWDINIWLKYMKLVEVYSEEPFDAIKSIFEKAVLYCSTGEAAGTLWLKYLEFLRRKVDIVKPSEKNLGILSKTFDAAETHLLQLLPDPNEYILEILLFRFRFESQCAKGVSEKATILWKDLINRGYGQYAKTWMQLILQEISWGSDKRKVRSLYTKAISYVKDDIQLLSSLWINFERDNGDLNSLEQCESKISQVVAKNAAVLAEEQQQTFAETMHSNVTTVTKGTKRKMVDGGDNSSKKVRNSQEDTVDSDKANSVFKMPSIPSIKNSKKEEVRASRHGEAVKHDSSKDNRTIFLSNLAYTTNETEIISFFSDVGEVEEVRLAKDFRGRSKGFGYVFFTQDADAKSALSKDRQLLQGRPAFVSKCDPDKSTRQKQFKYCTKLEKNKLFIKDLPLSLTADELRDMFKVHGELKDCRLVTYRNGHSKGLAYVEYIDETCAKQAILKTDGTEMGDKKISVAFSNPPPRDPAKSNYSSGSFTKTSTSSDQLKRRTPKAFVPRSLQVTTNSNRKEQEKPGDNPTAPKSNQDFRSMFLK